MVDGRRLDCSLCGILLLQLHENHSDTILVSFPFSFTEAQLPLDYVVAFFSWALDRMR